MALSLARKQGVRRREYDAYLQTRAWRARRRRWIERTRAEGFEPACQVCGARLDEIGELDLHHVDYSRIGHERYEDLWPYCRDCHERLHRVFDERRRDFRGWDRRRASAYVTALLRREHMNKRGKQR